ncbi:MAG TPA: acyl-CoA dehydrogenase family protein [Candidatus Dormibacteraeota bacterium]|jgi:alkylation response protein AidB-like acyl-CoA dehydrogenase|nr:acyl-CoA dehydrogenase family protein [Candidatus Dormibacteraeota bacterium]
MLDGDAQLADFAAQVDDVVSSWGGEPRQYFRGRGGAVRDLYRALGARDWLALSWPAEFGGAARPLAYEYVLWNRLAYHRAARPELGATIVARVLMRHGTAAQQEAYLPAIREGRVCFALGYSEPEAGSDLASVRTRAVRSAGGETYVVQGEKVWTSEAHHAEYLWCLCRTGEQDEHGRVLTLLIVDLAAPGVTVRPIPTIDGHHVNQVLLDGVEVPATARIGEENAAWAIVREGLAAERHLQFMPGRVRRDLEDLADLCRRCDVLSRDATQAALALLAARVASAQASAMANLAEAASGAISPVSAACTKVLGSMLAQDIAAAAFDLCGTAALDESEIAELLWRQTRMETVAGGSTEMLLGIVAASALRLRATT